jgi:hypothetical protein
MNMAASCICLALGVSGIRVLSGLLRDGISGSDIMRLVGLHEYEKKETVLVGFKPLNDSAVEMLRPRYVDLLAYQSE